MKMMTRLLSALAIGFVLTGLVLAGVLDPPGPPAPTMVTLQQIYDKIAVGAGVAKTGQTTCWDGIGTPISCVGTGQDGALQDGVSASPRFTDSGTGTVKDNLTGLIWLKNANCFGLQTWTAALSDANTLANGTCGLSDGSIGGSWRLANIRELESLVDFSQNSPALPTGHPFVGVQPTPGYLSSTTRADIPNTEFVMNIAAGNVGYDFKNDPGFVWPVRNPQ